MQRGWWGYHKIFESTSCKTHSWMGTVWQVAMRQISLASAPGLCLRQRWQKQMSRAALILHHLLWWSCQLVTWENLKFLTADDLHINQIYPVPGFWLQSRIWVNVFSGSAFVRSVLFCVIEREGYAKTTAMSERVLETGDLFLDIFYLSARATPATRIVHLCVIFYRQRPPLSENALGNLSRSIFAEKFSPVSLQRHEINGPFTAGWFCVCESATTFIGSFRFIMLSPRRSLDPSSYFWMPPHRLGGIKSPEDYIAALLFGRAADICVNSMLSPPGRWGLLSA